MTSRTIRRLAVAAALLLSSGLGCRAGESLALFDLLAPDQVVVTPVGLGAVRVEWEPVQGSAVDGYRLERRENLQGEFTQLVRLPQQSTKIVYLDTKVEPETFYGYRVVTVDRLGNESAPSTVDGGKTPSLPGIRVVTLSLVPAEISDPDGYTVAIEGPAETRQPIGVNDAQRISPLPVGIYTVRLEGVSAACRARAGESLERNVGVTDQGTATISEVRFAITCRDASKGELVAGVNVVGDQVPPNASFVLDVSGIASDGSLPESERIYTRTLTFGPGGGSNLLENLRPGEYVLTIGPVPSECLRQGAETQRRTLLALASDSLFFEVRCGSAAPNQPPVPVLNGPYTADVGDAIGFSSEGSADPDGQIVAYNWQFGDGTTSSGASPTKSYANAGVYTVTLAVIDNRGSVGVATTTATIGNQLPVAKANGPYAGVAGAPIQFSAAGSTDPDGTIASYQWDFGDGSTGTNATVTHAYQAAGTYQLTLTVRDNGGATDTDETTVTVTGGTGGSGTFTWTNSFGALDQSTQLVPLTLVLDLSGNTPATPGPEALDRWVVDSLTWDPAVLRFFAFTPAAGATVTADLNEAQAGKLKLFGSQSASVSTGVITLGTVRFKVVGGNGTRTTTATGLGLLLGTAATGNYSYLSETMVNEGTFTVGGTSATGTVRGTVTSSAGGGIAGATVTVNPGGTTATSASGQYSLSGVPVGSGTVTVSGLPSNCQALAAKPYTLSRAGQSAVVDFTATCSTGSPAGTVTGTVQSSTGIPLASATVTVAPGGVGSTNASGQYTVGNVPLGSGTVSVSGLPAGCTAPAGKPYTIASAGEVVTVDFSVTCTTPPASGTVSGTVTKSGGGGPISGATVTVTPGGTTQTNASGQYSVSNVAVGSGTVTVGGLPTGCTAPAGKPYTIASGGQTVTVDFTVTCSSSGSPNSLRGTWSVSGTTATLEFRLNVTQGRIGSMQAMLAVTSSRLQYAGFSAPTSPELGNPTASNPPATPITFGGFSTNPTGGSGDLGVVKLMFTILPGAATTVTPTLSGFGALAPDFSNITPSFAGNVSVDPLTLP